MLKKLPKWQRRGRHAAGSPARMVVFFVAVALLVYRAWNRFADTHPSPPPESVLVRVERVVDGDTLKLDGGVRVRLMGIDTPEIAHDGQPDEPWGREAAEWLKQRLTGKRVRLEYDREREDRYGRTLAFVYLGDVLINEEIVREGFGRAETRYPYSSEMKRRLTAAEDEARAAGRRMWSPPDR